jgi:hypothetical protein
MTWLTAEKEVYNQKVMAEGKDLQDKSVEELDQNLRKQWPRKGRLEVEVFQERKGQITAHNKKYERHVRTCLEKYNMLQEQWGLVMEQIGAEFKAYKEKHEKLKDQLPSGKNLAELQGMSRREKDALQIFSDKCQEFHDTLLDLGEYQPDALIKQNGDMLKSCALIENGGNYAEAEVAWYRGQMDEIDTVISESKTKRSEEITKVLEDMDALKKDPTADFVGEYNTSIQQLSAKEGLGKTFGQPRRLTQERLRSEMTKCEQAQKGIDQLIDKLEDLCEEAMDDGLTAKRAIEAPTTKGTSKKPELTATLQIRITLVQSLRSIQHYSLHLGGFKEEVKELERISYREDHEGIELDEAEKALDEKRLEEELEILGPIGYKNAKEPYVRFPEAIDQIDQMCKDICQKLYVGDNVKYLEGNDKIPHYLSVFLEPMKK